MSLNMTAEGTIYDTSTMSSSSFHVSISAIKSTSMLFVSYKTPEAGSTAGNGTSTSYTISNGSGFTCSSSIGTTTGTYYWELIL